MKSVAAVNAFLMLASQCSTPVVKLLTVIGTTIDVNAGASQAPLSHRALSGILRFVTGFARQLSANTMSTLTSTSANASATFRSAPHNSSSILKPADANASRLKAAPSVSIGTTKTADASADPKTALLQLNIGTQVPASAAARPRIVWNPNILTTRDAAASANPSTATRQASANLNCRLKSGSTTSTANANASIQLDLLTTTTINGSSIQICAIGSVNLPLALKASTLTPVSASVHALNLLAPMDTFGNQLHVNASASTDRLTAQSMSSSTLIHANASPAVSRFQVAYRLSSGTRLPADASALQDYAL